ncbi:MAG: ribonuclease HII [Waddliaceae bacterium]
MLRAEEKLSALLAFDKKHRVPENLQLAGADEAGRGPLAGPVVAACCYAGPDIAIPGVFDSKKLTPLQRNALFKKIQSNVKYAVGIVHHDVIDQINILEATKLATLQAIGQVNPDFTLIDGFSLSGIPCQKVIKGDQLSFLIACASIVAKCVRDKLMVEKYHALYPQYGFDRHKGYGTKMHREALKLHGPCPIHRLSFNFGLESIELSEKV